jgi:hypothetical protein
MATQWTPLPELPEGWYWDTITLTPPSVPVCAGEALPVMWVQRHRGEVDLLLTFLFGV